MTDHDLLNGVISIVDPTAKSLQLLRKNGRILLGLPEERTAATKTLRLYQPQRTAARIVVGLVKQCINLGLARFILPQTSIETAPFPLGPPFPQVNRGTCGILLGSPEHRVRRAIVSYQTAMGWEVAKVAFGPNGWDVIQGEANTLLALPENTAGAPKVLALHRGQDISLMRMPHIEGAVLQQNASNKAVSILDAWISDHAPKPMEEFCEWPLIQHALSRHLKAAAVTKHLSQLQLRPAVRHGDFARWNLLQTSDGNIMVLDWEWSTPCGMPGIDLVHLFAQDARLVNRLPAAEVVQSVQRSLQTPEYRAYLQKTGWGTDVASAIVASIAFTVGAKQQANEEVLEAALHAWHHANHR
jgi:hypothetical protein